MESLRAVLLSVLRWIGIASSTLQHPCKVVQHTLSIDGDSVTIEDGTDLTIALWFDIQHVLTWWEGGLLDGEYSLESDCGLRIGPPDIEVSIEQD